MNDKINLCRRFILLLTFILFGSQSNSQLVINVKNQGGDVVQETIAANVTDDTVTLEFQRPDGTLVTQLIDFRNEVQILKALVLGEEERGQSQYQVMCFIFHTTRDAFISSDAMSKLRQKNPGTIRTPEEDRGRQNYTMTYSVDLGRSSIISPHISDMCTEASDATYTRYEDIQQWATSQGLSENVYLNAVKRFPTGTDPLLNEIGVSDQDNALLSCSEVKKVWSPCQCHLELCIGWYPCGLKYCKGKGENKNSAMTYRCGIKTCRKCHHFSYFVSQKQLCLWDE
ncbi:out at first protein [Agrilus planipennis]|uniref:Out at first protein n=1 Tax=Agrilus planipennis TaxID=224129 RepID=A0A1W4WX50_AGRPL|nr:out at first protein [Agrilus planipennis]